MRYLEIEGETEKTLSTIIDLALKHGGLQVHHLVSQLLNSIKTKPTDEIVAN